ADKAFQVGELSSTDQTGMHLSSTNPNIIDSFADDNNAALTNAVYTNVRARTMLFKTPTEGSIFSVLGQIKCADEVDFNPGVFAGVRGYIETMDDTDIKSGAKMWAVEGCLDAALASYTVKSGGISAGFHAELTGAGTFTQDSTGVLAGLYIDETATSGSWGYGVYVTGADKVWYSSNTISGSTATNSMEIAVTDTQTNSSTYSRSLYVSHTATGDKTSTGEVNAVGIDVTPQGDAYIVTPLSMYTAGCADAVIGNLWGSFLYMD
ncbi:unnamed protein product, partial [marine sediment metagenome]